MPVDVFFWNLIVLDTETASGLLMYNIVEWRMRLVRPRAK